MLGHAQCLPCGKCFALREERAVGTHHLMLGPFASILFGGNRNGVLVHPGATSGKGARGGAQLFMAGFELRSQGKVTGGSHGGLSRKGSGQLPASIG